MADVKISELPVAAQSDTPDVVPIVQAGVTKQIDVAIMKRSKNVSYNVELYDAVFVRGISSALQIGNNDIYTVPNGRNALILGGRLWNESGGNVTAFPEIKHGGTYYRVGNSTASIANGAGAAMLTAGAGIVLSAGDSFAINAATTSGAIGIYSITEFSDQSRLKPAYIFGSSNGDNTLYVTPVGKTAVPTSFAAPLGTNQATFPFGTASVGTGTVTCKLIQSGGSPTVTLLNGSVGANSTGTVAQAGFSLEAGDSVILNVTTGDSGQIFWGMFVELDA